MSSRALPVVTSHSKRPGYTTAIGIGTVANKHASIAQHSNQPKQIARAMKTWITHNVDTYGIIVKSISNGSLYPPPYERCVSSDEDEDEDEDEDLIDADEDENKADIDEDESDDMVDEDEDKLSVDENDDEADDTDKDRFETDEENPNHRAYRSARFHFDVFYHPDFERAIQAAHAFLDALHTYPITYLMSDHPLLEPYRLAFGHHAEAWQSRVRYNDPSHLIQPWRSLSQLNLRYLCGLMVSVDTPSYHNQRAGLASRGWPVERMQHRTALMRAVYEQAEGRHAETDAVGHEKRLLARDGYNGDSWALQNR